MRKKESTIKNRLNMLLMICLIPLTILTLYLVLIMQKFSDRYDEVVQNITKANAYNIDFKDDLDYLMYIIVANSERADDLIDTEQPRRMIGEARAVFQSLYESADAEYGRQRLNRILKSLNILEDRVVEIEADAQISGSYDKNMERLDLDIHAALDCLTELIQEQIQEYIYYETTNLEALREEIRGDVDNTLRHEQPGLSSDSGGRLSLKPEGHAGDHGAYPEALQGDPGSGQRRLCRAGGGEQRGRDGGPQRQL